MDASSDDDDDKDSDDKDTDNASGASNGDARVIVWLENFMTNSILPKSKLMSGEFSHHFADAYMELKRVSPLTRSVYFKLRHRRLYAT